MFTFSELLFLFTFFVCCCCFSAVSHLILFITTFKECLFSKWALSMSVVTLRTNFVNKYVKIKTNIQEGKCCGQYNFQSIFYY